LEIWFRPEGVAAMEDPRQGLLRLLPAHGAFVEFIPPDEITSAHPLRHSLAEVETDVPYAVAVTSSAGVWACVVDDQVCFERRDPPLLRLRSTRISAQPPRVLRPSRTAGSLPVHLSPGSAWRVARDNDQTNGIRPARREGRYDFPRQGAFL
jgi:hypothetical protein